MPVTEVPAHWPEAYRRVVQRRIALIESDRNLGLIERPEYKRRWNQPSWPEREQAALREWLLDRLEAPRLWPASDEQPAQLVSVRRLADAVAHDADFLQVAELYAGQAGFDLLRLVQDCRGKVVLCGYDNALYNSALSGWCKVSYGARAGMGKKRVECLWMNYPDQLSLFKFHA